MVQLHLKCPSVPASAGWEVEIEEGAVLHTGAGIDFVREGVSNSLDGAGVDACLQRRWEISRELEWKMDEPQG